MTKYYQADDSMFPIVVTTLTSIEITDALFDEYLDYMDGWLKGGRPFVDIHVLSKSRFMSSNYRIKLNKFLKDRNEIMKRMKIGLIIVNDSVIMSMMLKGVWLFNPPSCQHAIVQSLDEAYKLADQVLKTGKL